MLVDEKIVPEGGMVVVLEPRRLAARMLAARVAFERRSKLGAEVGYQVRFEGAYGRETRILFVTEGILLRRMLGDPELRGIAAILFDEFHERHLYGDITLARALELQESARSDLKIGVMSATLDGAALEDYMAPCERLASAGRTYPVEIRHRASKAGPNPRDPKLWDEAADACEEALKAGAAGDFLIFMPGGYEIRKTLDAIGARKWARDFTLLPLHGELPPAAQDAAVAPGSGRRKIVVATNVAETSLTIPGVRIVIDGGLARVPDFDPRRGINTLTIRKISRASADQRAGRAGREAPGLCLRLWSERDHAGRDDREAPEIHRLDLAEAALLIKAGGCPDMEAFRWLDAPDPQMALRAEELLRDLGAADRGSGAITARGHALLAYPLHPRFAAVLEAAKHFGCLPHAALCAALMQGRDLFLKKKAAGGMAREDWQQPGDWSDFQASLRAFATAASGNFNPQRCTQLGVNAGSAREAGALAAQLIRIAGEKPPAEILADPAEGDLGRAILAGFSDHLASRLSPSTAACAVVGGRRGRLEDGSALRKTMLFAAAEMIEIEGRDVQVVLNNATAVREDWLRELFPGDFAEAREALWEEAGRRVIAVRQKRFRDLVLESGQSGDPDPAAAARILAEKIHAGELTLRTWDSAVESWIARLNSLAAWMPELELPAIGDGDRLYLLEEICQGASTYKQVKDASPWGPLRRWLNPMQQDLLERYAPERLKLANGRGAKVQYRPEGPTISLVLQQLYDVNETPAVAAGRVPVRVELLAPNQRPAAVTSDLARFWREGYPEVKKMLRGRYPKHEWR